MQQQGLSKEVIQQLTSHKILPGNKPHNIILLEQLTPFTLGALLALYEHATFVQGCVWGINSFDQWGVELGKQFAANILQDLLQPDAIATQDSSIANLVQCFQQKKTIELK